jgi:hypothetical protein
LCKHARLYALSMRVIRTGDRDFRRPFCGDADPLIGLTTRVRVGVIPFPLFFFHHPINNNLISLKNTEVKLHATSSIKSNNRTCLLQGRLNQLIKPPPYTDHDLRWTISSSMHSVPPNLVIDHLLVQLNKLRQNRIVALDLEAQSFSSIEDHTLGPQTDVELYNLALG